MFVQSCRSAFGHWSNRTGVHALIACSCCGAFAFGELPRPAFGPPGKQELTPAAMEALPDANPLNFGRHFLTGLRVEGMNEAELCANLGDNPRLDRLDRDNFAFDGTAGEEVAIRLAPSGANFQGTHASLVLVDQIRNIQFFRADHSALPNALRGKLPATGRYVITVQEGAGVARERPYQGDYCLTFRSTGNAAASLRPTDSVEGANNVPPTANAGPDQTAADTNGDGSESVQLDGSKSKDTDGRIVSFDWSENGKSIGQGMQPRVTLPVGRHDLTLTVTDDEGATDSDNVQIIVEENMAQCALDEDCPDDHNACTDTYCILGQCENVRIDDIECNDNDACTTDSCDPIDGCQHATVGCDDNDACTTDTCDAATGCAHAAVTCNDNNACTTDTCDPAEGCRFTDNSSPCNDGDACTNNDQCTNGSCAGTALPCNDGLFCNGSESCAAGVCTTTGQPCSAGQVCDEAADACVQCVTNMDCTDTDPCTSNLCVNHQCQTQPVPGCCRTTADCNDGTLCTLDRCVNNVCSNPPRNCSDNNACTVDTCSRVTGCVSTPISCEDGNVCTTDSCDTKLGCRNLANTASCDDQDSCTIADTCQNGTCGGVEQDCDDGLFCTGTESCLDGDCSSSGNPCADGQFCDEVSGCTNQALTSGTKSGTLKNKEAGRPTMSATVEGGK